jgi:hypothetical protein
MNKKELLLGALFTGGALVMTCLLFAIPATGKGYTMAFINRC